LPQKVAGAIATLYDVLASNRYRAGRRLSFELTGLLVARRGEYLIVYRVVDEDRIVESLRVEHRRDVYRP
jgi:mRNA-degrading endonuclease RelE of RelBE toxin-antitoxin system